MTTTEPLNANPAPTADVLLAKSLRWNKKPAVRWIGIPALALAIFGVYHVNRGFWADVKRAENAVDRFHGQFNAGSINQIYEESSGGFRDATREKDFVELVSTVRRKLGNVIDSKREADMSENTRNEFTTLNVTYRTAFTQGQGEEKFVWQIKDGKALLRNYTINSRDLILK